ncbi:spore coat protein [Anaerosalibacter sp. Marseille-P3206]|uniref:spore coat protein n=1 Tax=Anaerosalibacter sp. Marseille-P3206 TaxID=1871005 RepID=UPI0009851AB2|nr:spore coat protein [Anaerosalibacter sp. Marseille-P3206]
MQEKDMVSDVLSTTKSSITNYATAITECANAQLRGTLQQLRNEAEQFQYQLFQIAEQKGYYTPAPTANQQDVQSVKNGLSGGGPNIMK